MRASTGRRISPRQHVIDRHPSEPRDPKGKPRDAVINIRLTAEMKERFAQAAEAAGMSVGAFMRNATIEKIEGRQK